MTAKAALVLAAILSSGLAATAASAQSLDTVTTNGDSQSRSVLALSCKECPPPKDPNGTGDYVVQELAKGETRIEYREIGGKRKMVLTEAFMGGSPVVFISTPLGEVTDTAIVDQPMPPKEDATVASPVIDTNTTSAVTADTAASPVVPDAGATVKIEEAAPAAPVKAFDPDSLTLR